MLRLTTLVRTYREPYWLNTTAILAARAAHSRRWRVSPRKLWKRERTSDDALGTRTPPIRTSQTVLPGRCEAFPEAQWSLCRSWRSVCWPGARGTSQCPENNTRHWFRVKSMTGVHTHTYEQKCCSVKYVQTFLSGCGRA